MYSQNQNDVAVGWLAVVDVGYSDADWAGDLDNQKSTSGYIFNLCGGAVSWRSKKQCVALSTAEAEYMALASAAQEAVWLQHLPKELKETLEDPTKIYEDNQSTIYMTNNAQFHGQAKHIDIKYHYVQEQVLAKVIELKYWESENMIADILTKGLGLKQFENLREHIGMKQFSNIEWGGVLKIDTQTRKF